VCVVTTEHAHGAAVRSTDAARTSQRPPITMKHLTALRTLAGTLVAAGAIATACSGPARPDDSLVTPLGQSTAQATPIQPMPIEPEPEPGPLSPSQPAPYPMPEPEPGPLPEPQSPDPYGPVPDPTAPLPSPEQPGVPEPEPEPIPVPTPEPVDPDVDPGVPGPEPIDPASPGPDTLDPASPINPSPLQSPMPDAGGDEVDEEDSTSVVTRDAGS
jgi:hypothetical protein